MYKTSNYFISQCATFRPIIYEKFKKIKEAAIEESFERYNNANHWKELIPEKLYESKIEIEYDVIFNACSEKDIDEDNKEIIIKNFNDWLKETSLARDKFMSTDSIGFTNRLKDLYTYGASRLASGRYDESKDQYNKRKSQKKLKDNIKKFIKDYASIIDSIKKIETEIKNNEFTIEYIITSDEAEKIGTRDSPLLDSRIERLIETSNVKKNDQQKILDEKQPQIDKIKDDIRVNQGSIIKKQEEIKNTNTDIKNLEEKKTKNQEKIKQNINEINENKKIITNVNRNSVEGETTPDAKEKNEELEKMNTKLNSEIELLDNEINKNREKLEILEGDQSGELGDLQQKNEELEKMNTELEKEIVEPTRIKKQAVSFEKSIEKLKSKITTIQDMLNVEKTETYKDLLKNYKLLNDAFTANNTNIEKIKKDLDDKLEKNNNILNQAEEKLKENLNKQKKIL